VLYLPGWHERAVAQGTVVYDPYVLYEVVASEQTDDKGSSSEATD